MYVIFAPHFVLFGSQMAIYRYEHSLSRYLPWFYRNSNVYLPDIILYDLNAYQYKDKWYQLQNSRYIYTDGYNVRPTSWLMYAFQSIKGWFGFNNNCDSKRVSYALEKLAYYGHVKGYEQPDFDDMTYYQMSKEFNQQLKEAPSQNQTKTLQNLLVQHYLENKSLLSDSAGLSIRANHQFGQSWLAFNVPELVPQLDPQDDKVINETIRALVSKKISAETINFIKDSQFAKRASEHFCQLAKEVVEPSFFWRFTWTDPRPRLLEDALIYNPDVAKNHASTFIEHYIQQKDYANAIKLMNCLSDEVRQKAYLLKIPDSIREQSLTPDSVLANVMAKHYLQEKQYEKAQKLSSNIEALDVGAAFHILIQQKEYIKAFQLFKRVDSPELILTEDKKAAATVFDKKGEELYQSGKMNRELKQWDAAVDLYFESYLTKKAAWELNPATKQQESYFEHKRLYAQIVIDRDIALHPANESDVSQIHKAIKHLRECTPERQDEKKQRTKALASGLLRSIDHMIEKISFEKYQPDWKGAREHKLKHLSDLNILIKELKELVGLLEDTKSSSQREQLSKAYFLLADVQEFFDIPDPYINQYYKMATEKTPDNPFYRLRAAEKFKHLRERYQESGVINLKQLGYEVIDYIHWFDERWVKRDNKIFDIKDIHELNKHNPADDQNDYGNLFGWVGFGT